MALSNLSKSISGGLFGAALLAAGVYSPDIILAQMRFQNFHMLQTFLTATATSILVMVAAKHFQLSECKPRQPASLNRLAKYDGNIIGGLLLGAGMTLTGACPGTVLVQVATGVRSGVVAFGGGLVGGFLYPLVAPYLRRRVKKEEGAESEQATVHAKLGVKEANAILGFEMLALGTVLAAASLTPSLLNTFLHPIVGGLLIGASQLASMILTGNAVGSSALYEEVGKVARSLVSSNEHPTYGSIFFGAGALAGSWILSRAVPNTVLDIKTTLGMGRAFVGGVAMVFGSRLAGGCTSGHGISGMSTLSVASFATVAATFAGGMGLAVFM